MNDLTARLLKRSRRTLEAAKRDLDADDSTNSISRAYYASFHAVMAVLNEARLNPRSHSGAQKEFFDHFVRSGHFDRRISSLLSSLFQMRLEADYALGESFDIGEARRAVRDATEVIESVEIWLSGR